MDNQQAQELLIRYQQGKVTEAEKALVEESLLAYNEDAAPLSEAQLEQAKHEVLARLSKAALQKQSVKLWVAVSAAAAVVVFALTVLLKKPEPVPDHALVLAESILPQGNVATVTLGNGKKIVLDDSSDGVMIKNDQLVYSNGETVNVDATSEYQTISTPRGGEYKILLSDGSKVWLNAATVLQYPLRLIGRRTREVKLLSGEAYFEIAKDEAHPFVVLSQGQKVTVLGTHFNINTYQPQTKTTLLEGSVSLSTNTVTKPVLLKPNQQAINQHGTFNISYADTELAVAWIKGRMKFNDAPLPDILTEAARWYDIEVRYDGEVPDIRITGGISRQSSLATLLKLLKMSGVNYGLNEEQGKKMLIIERNNQPDVKP